MHKKKKILVLDNQIIVPPESGGPLRIFNLFGKLSDSYDVTYLGVTGWQYLSSDKKKIDSNFHEQIIPLSKPFIILNNLSHNLLKSIPTFDISCAYFMPLTPQFMKTMNLEARDADIIVTSHPWFARYMRRYRKKITVYDSHNCEYLLYKSFFKNNLLNRCFLWFIKHIEGIAVRTTDLVLTCSKEDAASYSRIYKIEPRNIETIPNPIDVDSFKVDASKNSLKIKYDLKGKKCVIFVGTYFLPNIEAFEFILDKLAKDMPDYTFLIIGSVDKAYSDRLNKDIVAFDSSSVKDENIYGLGWFEAEKWGHEGFDVRWTKQSFSFYINEPDIDAIILNYRSLKKINGSLSVNGNSAGKFTFKTGIEFKKKKIPLKKRKRCHCAITLDRLSRSLFFDTRDVGIAIRGISYIKAEKEVELDIHKTVVMQTYPENVKVFGRVDNDVLRDLLKLSDVAINPVSHGSGLNIKMLDYMAARLPIVTTKIGMRGLDIKKSTHLKVSSLDGFPSAIADAYSDRKKSYDLYESVKKNFDYKVLASELETIFNGLIKKIR